LLTAFFLFLLLTSYSQTAELAILVSQAVNRRFLTAEALVRRAVRGTATGFVNITPQLLNMHSNVIGGLDNDAFRGRSSIQT
jgi:hypothetical protein